MNRLLGSAFAFGLSLCSIGLGGLGGLGGVANAADSSFSLKYEVPVVKKGQRSIVKVHLVPGSGFHVNKDFPTSLVIAPPVGIAVEKPRQAGKDATLLGEAGADFEVALIASEAGSKLVTGDFKFAVCSATSCDPKKEKVSFTVDVK